MALITAVMVLAFTAKKERVLCPRNLLAPVLAGGIGVGGYFLAETGLILLGGGTWQAAVGGAVLGILPNTIQEIVGGSAYILVAAALDRPDVKKRLTKW